MKNWKKDETPHANLKIYMTKKNYLKHSYTEFSSRLLSIEFIFSCIFDKRRKHQIGGKGYKIARNLDVMDRK